ncbi:thermonuclease family protein [Pontibacter sp. Tf4]|uniref:thermonuclease family protein n=1 Tax=Pontibacter sp. Tf4 TaxID=2761620 RepID=UPI0016256F6D|nr:thermonuclease family protein [Pontibacter sp. Tf4]MBB6612481.1 thermonuclease family protein [Pontibacter sp. Tf4]
MFSKLYLYLALICLFACKQTDKQEVQEQFRQRQQAARQGATDQHSTATQPTPQTTTAPQQPENAATPTPAGDKVVAVKDGDTIELLRNGETIKVRLYGVDSPEKTQDFGQRARQFTSDLAFGKQVRLIVHNKDRYGRTVGTIILPDGRNLNEELVKNGMAWHYKAYSKDKNLANLEADARRYKRGLWAEPNPTPPWDYRKNERELSAEKKAKKEVAAQNAPLPAGATKRTVYLCNSSGSNVYHVSKNCSVLKRCKADVLTVTEAVAIREYNRRADKTCAN